MDSLRLKRPILHKNGDAIEFNTPPGIYGYAGRPQGIPTEAKDYGVIFCLHSHDRHYIAQIIIDAGNQMFFRFTLDEPGKKVKNEWKQVATI